MSTFRSLLLCGLVLASALAAGCGGAAVRDMREDRDPLLRRARERKNAQDFKGAEELYQKALAGKPDLARAHLELGLLYDQDLGEYVRAIYHYQRYMALRPDAEKKEIVQEMLDRARLSFAASLPDKPSGAVQEIASLRRQIEILEDQLAQRAPSAPPRPAAASAPAPASPAPAATPVPAAPPLTQLAATAPRPAAPSAAMDAYVVQPGDNLSRIASKFYGDRTRWQVIYEANRSQLAGPQSIRVGQTLMIPKQERR